MNFNEISRPPIVLGLTRKSPAGVKRSGTPAGGLNGYEEFIYSYAEPTNDSALNTS